MKIKDLPETERPYERLEIYGEKSLSNAELLAIIIKTGTKEKTSIEIANQILNLNIRHILSETIKVDAPKIILVHNHPSGDSTPSNSDIETTLKLKQAAKILNIELVDHIIIGNMNYNSIMSKL